MSRSTKRSFRSAGTIGDLEDSRKGDCPLFRRRAGGKGLFPSRTDRVSVLESDYRARTLGARASPRGFSALPALS